MKAIPKRVECPKCKKKFNTLIGDIRPHFIICEKCGFKWRYDGDDKYMFPWMNDDE